MCLLQVSLIWSLGWYSTVPFTLDGCSGQQQRQRWRHWLLRTYCSAPPEPGFLACTLGSVEQQRQWLEREVAIDSMTHPVREAAQRRLGESAFAQDDAARQVGTRLHEVQQVKVWVCLLT